MKIIVIGGTGFIGKEVTKLLLKNKHQVLLFQRNKSKFSPDDNLQEILADRKDLIMYSEKFISFKPDVVIDIISYTPQDAWSFLQTFSGIVKKVVLLSSGDVYQAYGVFLQKHKKVQNTPLDEFSSLRRQLFPFRKTGVEYDELMFNYDKIISEQLTSTGNFSTIILRLPGVFGEGDKQQKLYEYINPMIKNQDSIMLSKGKSQWIMTRGYVKNIAYAVYLMTINEEEESDIYNIGDFNLSELEIVQKLKELTNWRGEIVISYEFENYNYKQNIETNFSKFHIRFQYTPPYIIEDSFVNTINYYRSIL